MLLGDAEVDVDLIRMDVSSSTTNNKDRGRLSEHLANTFFSMLE